MNRLKDLSFSIIKINKIESTRIYQSQLFENNPISCEV